MRFTRHSVVFCLALAATACSELQPTDPPSGTAAAPGDREAPAGYKWKKAHCMHVLIPDGWYYMELEGKGTKAFFVSKESIDREGKFKTGLTSNMVVNIRARTGISPSENATVLFESLKSTSEYQDIKSTTPTAELTQLSGYFRTKNPSSGNVIVQYLTTYANNKTGTLYIVQFETRAADWDKTVPIGKVLINNLIVDDAC